MSAFIKTMFGDRNNVATVAAILGVTAAIEASGSLRAVWIALPLMTLAGVAWLVRK